MAGSRTNPNDVGVPNAYAGFVSPERPDASTVGLGGNQVNRAAINKTKTQVGTPTAAKPFGPSEGSGY